MDDPIRAAIQAVLDACGDGYSVTEYVVGMWIERPVDGELECIPWLLAPPHQSPCRTQAVKSQSWLLNPSSEGMTTDA